jgi:hypothetical protein
MIEPPKNKTNHSKIAINGKFFIKGIIIPLIKHLIK